MNQDIFVVIEHLQGQVAEISYVMLAAARGLVEQTGRNVVAVLLGHKAEGLAGDLSANRVLYVDHPALTGFTSEAYIQVLAGLISAEAPRAVLFGDTSMGAEVAGGLSLRLGMPLVSYCRSLYADGGAFKFTSQICGGKIMVEGDLPAPMAFVTMIPGGYKADQGRGGGPPDLVALPAPELQDPRIRLVRYIQPETVDVDISKEEVLVSVGRGFQNQDNLFLAEELAQALGGTVSASRPVVDQAWLPATRLVGKSGKRDRPKIYLALGISGAPEHVEAIGDSQVIVAVNTDPAAPIFNVAKYGANVDLFDLVPALTEQVNRIRSA